jgi:DNA ligase D-like protein (predicted 3'-phosphoesterase)
MDPSIKRLAVPTEDHPMAYSDFEGVIPEGHYGAEIVLVWDRGTYHNLKDDDSSIIDNINDGHVTITLNGEKLVGGFALLRTGGGDKPRWLFFKMKDSYAKPGSAILDEQPNSVKTGRSLEEVADQESPADLHDFS